MSTPPQQLTGTIVWYSKKQGFGFVAPDTQGDDIFVHHSALEDGRKTAISVGDRVSFRLEERKKGPSAVDISPLNGANSTSNVNAARRTSKKSVRNVSDRRKSIARQRRDASSSPTMLQQNRAISPSISSSGHSFASLELQAGLLRAVQEAGYSEPTSIQMQAIPHVLQGRDVMGCAQTGTGKTAAFALPIIQRLSDSQNGSPNKRSKRGIRALVLSPTRELAIQIKDSFSTYGRYSGLNNTAIFGGVNAKPQIQAIRNGIDVLIATPGRLLDLMGQGHIRLENVEVLILDEADRMLDMGFIHDVKRIINKLPRQRQTLLFSATLAREIIDLADSILDNPIHVSVAPEQPTVEAIQQGIYFVSTKKKQALLEHVLADPNVERTLVFTRTKRGANRVVKNLKKAGIEVEPIHGNKSQAARQKALQRFREGKIQVLVATDVVSRGIDVDEITHVIQYDLPNEPEVYVHRIGRTGRAGAAGTALAFCSETERGDLKAIEKLIKMKVPIIQDWTA